MLRACPWLAVMVLGACGTDEVVGAADAPDSIDAGDDAAATTAADVVASDSLATADSAASGDGGDGADSTKVADSWTPAVDADPATFGGDRPANVVLPPAYDPAKAWPLVMLLHGYGASGALQDLYLGFSATASQAGFITIIPEGTKDGVGSQFWNATPGWCCDFGHSGVDDDGYLVGLVLEAERRWHIDPAETFLFGHSNGGFMAHKLACVHASVFAAIGVIAGSLPKSVSACNPSEPVSVLQIHGTLDAVIFYAGTADYPGAEEVVDRWASYDECMDHRVASDPVDYDSFAAGAETTPSAWTDCQAGASVALWSMAGSGHVPIVADGPMIGDALAWLRKHSKTGGQAP